MKKVLFLCFFAGISLALQSQDPVKDMKKAARLLGTYNLDPTLSADKLTEAVTLANASINDPLVKVDPLAWQAYGDIFMTIVNNDVARIYIDTNAVISDPSAAVKAFTGYKMVAELADKAYQTKDAMEALSAGIQNIYYMGSALYQDGDYKGAYATFKATYDGFLLLNVNKEETTFPPDEAYNALYYAGLTAERAKLVDEAIEVYQGIININYPAINETRTYIKGTKGGCYYTNASGNKVYVDKKFCGGESSIIPDSYTALFSLYLDEKKDTIKAQEVLKSARELFPENVGLLYSEINLALAKGELVSLIASLEKALALDPGNISIYITLGQIYDKLYQDKITTDPVAAEENFAKAMSYYQQALVKDPKSFDATYSIGALWYNKAAAYSVELNAFASDVTPAGNKKWDAKKAQMDETFVKALPHFQQAEILNPKDLNTLTALKEIYARQDKFDLVASYKQKIDALGGQ